MDFRQAWIDSCSSVGKAVRVGDIKYLRKLIRDGRPVDVCDNRGWRPIHEAAVLRTTNPQLLLEELLKHEDTDPNWKTHEGETAMLLACKHNTEDAALKAVEILLRYKADPNLTDNEEETPILAATRSSLTSVVKLLASHDCVDVNKGDYGGWTPLHEAATRGHVDMLTTLINASAKLCEKDECGMTPIFTAAQHGRLQCLQLLIEEAKTQDTMYLMDEGANDGASPLMIAAQQGFTECIKFLIVSGADANKCANDGVNALHLAAECGHPDTLQLLLSHMNINEFANELIPQNNLLKVRNPLHLAIRSEKTKCLEVMIKSNFPIDSVDYLFEQKFSMGLPPPKYITPLGLAVSLNYLETAKFLLKYGANPNCIHPNVYSPAHCVFSIIDFEIERDPNLEMFELLLKNKADVNFCRSDHEPNELIHAIFKPVYLKMLFYYGLDIRTCFKEGYVHRLLALSLHTLTLDWYHNVLPKIIKYFERNAIVFDHLTALAHHIEHTYRVRFGIEEYNPSIWTPIMNLFETPHTLKEYSRFAIRRRIYLYSRKKSKCFPDVIKSLDIPLCLQNYLLFEDFTL